MRRAGLLCILFVLAVFLFGCGGSGGDKPSSILIQQSISPFGGVIKSADGSFELTIPSGAFTKTTEVTAEIFAKPIQDLEFPQWSVLPKPVRLTFDPSVMTDSATIQVRMNLPTDKPSAPEDYLIGMTCIEPTAKSYRRDGILHALEEEKSTKHSIEGRFTKHDLTACLKTNDVGVLLFSAARPDGLSDPEDAILISSVFNFNGSTFSGSPPDLTGKRVAIIVHGIESSLADLTTLAQFVYNVKKAGTTTSYYDAVIGYQYTSNVPISEIGESLGQLTQPLIAGASDVDLYAHSMGNLVSRYAMENTTQSNRIGSYIDHYVSLGGPHTGVPFAELRWFRTLLLMLPLSAKPCLEDLTTNGIGGAGLTSFLADLNTTSHGPDYATSHYYTMTGSDYHMDIFIPGGGDIVNHMYSEVAGHSIVDDGLVAEYSGQNNVLAQQSQTWTTGPTFDLTHTELHTSTTAFNQLQSWLNSW